MRRLFGYIIAVIALLGMGLGFLQVYQTEMRLLNSAPVSVLVTDKRLEPVRNTEARIFNARVFYRYEVNGEIFIGKKVLAYDFSTPVILYLEEVIEPYKIGEHYVAYYQSNNPQESFLRKSIPYPPYMLILFSLFLFITGLFMTMTPGKGKDVPVPVSGGWYRFPANNASLIEMKNATKSQAIVFTLVSVITFADYYVHALQPYGIWEISSTCAFILIASLLWKQAIVNEKRAKEFDDLFFELNAPILQFDREYKAKIRQKARRQKEILSVDLGVTTHKGSAMGEELSQLWYENPCQKILEKGETLKVEQEFKIAKPNFNEAHQEAFNLAFSLKTRVVSKSSTQVLSFPIKVST